MLRTASSRLAAPLRKGRSTALINRSGNRSSASSTRSASTIANTARRDNKESPAASSRKLFWATALCGALLSTVLAQPLLAEDAKKNGDSTSAFTKDDIGVICIIGGPSSGKSTQLENVSKRFNLVKIDASKQDLKKTIEKLVSENASSGNKEKVRVVVEGFPRTIEQADKFEKEVVPILLIISIVLDAPKGVERVQGNDESLRRDAKINWKRFEEASEGLIKQFRYQGNILEITGEWPKDEVWEQVEAKLESALELDDRGEL